MSQKRSGFTIVELLIVIVVIGILAAIVIVAYNGISNRANDTAVQSDLASTRKVLDLYRVEAGEYPRTKATLDTLTIKASKGSYDTSITRNFIYCITNSGATAYQAFKLVAVSKSGTIYQMTENGMAANSFVIGDLTSSFCNNQGANWGLVSNGMFAADTWQTWVH